MLGTLETCITVPGDTAATELLLTMAIDDADDSTDGIIIVVDGTVVSNVLVPIVNFVVDVISCSGALAIVAVRVDIAVEVIVVDDADGDGGVGPSKVDIELMAIVDAAGKYNGHVVKDFVGCFTGEWILEK